MIDHDMALEPDEPGGFAFDRSARTKDADGRMRVEACRISKSNVCQYIGYEVPGHEALGLDPNRIYNLYRDRAALKAAAPSFSNVPLLIEHAAVSASEPRKQLVVGTVSSVRYEHPYLVADLMCWDAEAIRLIESGAQRELSCGYGYRADMNRWAGSTASHSTAAFWTFGGTTWRLSRLAARARTLPWATRRRACPCTWRSKIGAG